MPDLPRKRSLDVLRSPELRRFEALVGAATLAFSLLRATVAWHLWRETGSYAFLGTLGLVEFAPVIPFTLLGGAVADARDRRAVIGASVLVSALCVGALAALTFAGESSALPIFVVAFCMAISGGFYRPALSALLARIVPPEDFPAATVVNANVRNAARVSGPMLMGLMTGAWGIGATYALSAGLYLVAAGLSLTLVKRPPEAGSARISGAAIREGIAFVRSRPAVLGAMSLDMFAVIFAGATALLPVFADEILGVGEVGYGVLAASMQVGTLLMAAMLLVLPTIVRPGRWLLWAVAVFGLATVVFGFSRSFPLSVASFIAAGMADQINMTTRSIIVQLSTPDALRGRVSAVSMIFIGASNELGAAESGYLAAISSATFATVFGGGVCVGIAGVTAATNRSLRAFDVNEATAALAADAVAASG